MTLSRPHPGNAVGWRLPEANLSAAVWDHQVQLISNRHAPDLWNLLMLGEHLAVDLAVAATRAALGQKVRDASMADRLWPAASDVYRAWPGTVAPPVPVLDSLETSLAEGRTLRDDVWEHLL